MNVSNLALERPLVSVRGVRKTYDKGAAELVVLENVDLSLRSGEIVGLLGRSGSGKSTLLRAIAGLLQPSAGEIAYRDGGPDELAMVFQSFALFPWLTVQQNVEVGLEARGVAPEERRRRALEAIDLIGLDGYENAYPKELSGGMRQRVGLARALVVHPRLLLMDEPFSALDVHTRHLMQSELLRLWQEDRKSLLFITHDLEEAIALADRVVVMSAGPASRPVGDVGITLPRPRNVSEINMSDAFIRLYREIWSILGTEVEKSHAVQH